MSLPRGPVRIVLLRSGGYDYADLEVHAPLHLVAANNVGKTTLIAALQFLYIDDARQMQFSHDFSETRKHYFPHAGSAVLFECMTPTGFQVFGLRGLGPVQGHEYERFVYAGQYDRADYVDGRKVRPWDEVARRLVGRSLAVLEPRHLRASLTGSGDAKGPPLGLVPLKRSGSYESFRFLFRNLLRLSRIEQDQLKRLFIDITGSRIRKSDVDLRRDYAELFARVERQAESVVALQKVAPSIEELVTKYRERDRLRAGLAQTWAKIEAAFGAERVRAAEAQRALLEEQVALADQKRTWEAEQETIASRASAVDQRRGATRDEVRRLEAQRDRVRDFVPELEEAARVQLTAHRDELVARLAQAARAGRRDVEHKLAQTRSAIDRDTRLVREFAAAVVTWLREKSGLRDAELDDAFRLLNPAILGEVVGEGGVSIEDADAAVEALRTIRDRFDASGFRGAGVILRRTVLPSDPPLAQYQDVESIRARLGSAHDELANLEQTLADIAAREELTQKKAAVESDLESAGSRLRDWRAWQDAEPRLAVARRELADLDRQAADCARNRDDLQKRLTKLALEQVDRDRREEALRAALERTTLEVQRLQPPPAGWHAEVPSAELDALPLDALIQGYRDAGGEQRRLDQRVEHLFGEVEHKTAGHHVGATEAGTIARLADELAALEDHARDVQSLWTSLVDDMRSAFKSLVEGVDEVRREVSRLTQALGRRQISNLERVELELVKQNDLLRRLNAVIDAEAAPLFAGPDGRSRAARDIASWLEDRPRIELAELFDLRFRVIDRTGQTKTFDSLTQIESQGTSITIKVLVHLELPQDAPLRRAGCRAVLPRRSRDSRRAQPPRARRPRVGYGVRSRRRQSRGPGLRGDAVLPPGESGRAGARRDVAGRSAPRGPRWRLTLWESGSRRCSLTVRSSRRRFREPCANSSPSCST